MFELLKMPAGQQPCLYFCECQQDISHILTFVSASRISIISGLLKVGYCKFKKNVLKKTLLIIPLLGSQLSSI